VEVKRMSDRLKLYTTSKEKILVVLWITQL